MIQPAHSRLRGRGPLCPILAIDLFMGLFRGAVFHHGGVPEKKSISLNGAFLLLNGPFSDLNGPFPRMP